MSKTLEKAKKRQDELFHEMSALLGALASPVRLKIIHFLSQAPHSVEQLSLKLGQTIANTSMHLKKMQRENILKSQTLGQKRIYSLAQPGMKDFWEEIQNFTLQHNPENTIASAKIYPENLTWNQDPHETIKMIKAKKLTLLDVRPLDEVDETDTKYLKYVLHLPYSDLKTHLDTIPKSRPVIIICRGRLCVMANESTAELRTLGFKAYKWDLSWFEVSKYL